MFYDVNSKSIRFTGRWNVTDWTAITTAPGGAIECAFQGEWAVLHFDVATNAHPYPHLWIRVDGGAKTEVPLERYLRIEAESTGNHHVEIIFKSAVEMQHRWYAPLIGKVSFCGFESDEQGVLPEDNRPVIEFIGDSITEGVLIDAQYDPGKLDQPNRVYQDDATATYAWLTAKNLGMKPVVMGYGATGFLTAGQGAVPKAIDAYPYCYNGVPYKGSNPEIIVLNYGVNDRLNEKTVYLDAYCEFLLLLRKRNPQAIIVALSPFYGVYEPELKETINSFNKDNNENIIFIGTDGWIPQTPLHPLREGHRIVAERLTEELNKHIQK